MIRVYKYGLLPPITNDVAVRAQMLAGHRYHNANIEVDNARRVAARALMAEQPSIEPYVAAVDLAEAELVKALMERDAERARTRKRVQSAAVTTAKETKKTAVAAWREAKKGVREDMSCGCVFIKVPHLRRNGTPYLKKNGEPKMRDEKILMSLTCLHGREERNNYAATEAAKTAYRATEDLAWGTRKLVDDAMIAARKTPLYDDLEFRRWRGEGTLGGSYNQKGKSKAGYTLAEVRDVNPWFYITRAEAAPAPAAPVDPTRTRLIAARARNAARHLAAVAAGGGSTAERCILHMRIDTEGGSPVMAEWPMIMHRPLPPLAIVRYATVSLRKRGPREEWTVQITVSMPARVRQGRGTVAVDLGWRLMEDGIRVARTAGTDGAREELRLDAFVINGLRKVDELKSIREGLFNAAREELAAWLKGREVPAWLTEATEHLGLWKHPGRLAALTLRWRDARFEGDDMFGTREHGLEGWRYRDHHLWTYQEGQRIGALRHRREVYRTWAAKLADRYGTVVFEDLNLADLAKKTDKGGNATDNATARGNRHLAAVSELRLVVQHAFNHAAKVSAVDTTTTCHACGVVEPFDAATYLTRTCPHCGVTWDQDDNAAVNLLERYLAAPAPGGARGVGKVSDVVTIHDHDHGRAGHGKERNKSMGSTSREAHANGGE